jgi:hypothetical protein
MRASTIPRWRAERLFGSRALSTGMAMGSLPPQTRSMPFFTFENFETNRGGCIDVEEFMNLARRLQR